MPEELVSTSRTAKISAFRKALLWTNFLLLVLVISLALTWYYEIKYMTASAPEYVQTSVAWLAALTGAVTWLSGIAWGMQYVYNRFRRRPEPKKLTHEQMMKKYLPTLVDRILRPALHSIWLAATLAAAATLIAYDTFHVGPPFLPPGGPIIVTPTVARLPYTRHQ